MIVHDLDEIIYLLVDSAPRRDDAMGLCSCGAVHTQETNFCQDCEELVVWLNSPVWKRLYGNPKEVIRSMEVDLRPLTPLEVYAVRWFGKDGKFQNQSQMNTMRRLRKRFPDAYMKQLLEWAEGKGWTAFIAACENSANYDKWLAREVGSYQNQMPGDELRGN
jgi:hypothetical protein